MTDHLTLIQRTNIDGFPKAGELIEITGAHELEASDRAILNLLYQHAHDSGRMGERMPKWAIPLGAASDFSRMKAMIGCSRRLERIRAGGGHGARSRTVKPANRPSWRPTCSTFSTLPVSQLRCRRPS